PNSDGPRPLDAARYFARLCQRLINAITAPTAEGKLYEVDMRLRPSGNAGPIASHINAFIKYHEERAWTWEHMALARARIMCGADDLVDKINAVINRTLTAGRDPVSLIRDISEMRSRIDRERHTDIIWEVKYIRGGLVDIEFITQYLQLNHAAAAPEILSTNTMEALGLMETNGFLSADDAKMLRGALMLWQAVQGMLRLTLSGAVGPGRKIPEALKRALVQTTGSADFDQLQTRMAQSAENVSALFNKVIPPNADQSDD
ncbi:MAG: glutamine-synthetase adenylyltransferase, partial [Rhodospirillales bacterium]|nr:glutamine-synthetase adenylyltransferase [Rhodospirillales bacterium]